MGEGDMNKERDKGKSSKRLYLLGCLDDVLTVSRILASRGYQSYAEVWQKKNGTWYLLLEEEKGEGDMGKSLAFIEEYGTREKDSALLFFREHATLLLREDTIATLAPLASHFQ
jgi:hypothetical protein